MSRIGEWFTYRWPIRPVLRWGLDEEIPGGSKFAYCLGAASLFAFLIQVVTGIWQLFYYVPATDNAYSSVMYIRQQVPYGWLMHGLHYWGSNAFLVLVSLHMVRVFVWGAYKHPRQLTWMAGVLLLMTVVALSFTGALLAWDEAGYWAAEVGTSIAGTVPLVGFIIKQVMRGGAAMGQAALSRFFIAHVALLPGLLMLLFVIHIVAFRQFGSVGPWNEAKRTRIGRFWPEQIFKDTLVLAGIFVVLVALCAFWRAPVTGPADPIDDTITPKPEWQFLFLYQFLKLFKGRAEPVGTVGVPLACFLILLLLPFYDRGRHRNPFRRPLAMLGGLAFVGWLIVYTILGSLSQPGAALAAPVPVSAKASSAVRAGARLFSDQGCVACHIVSGVGGDIGPDLSEEGAKGRSRPWLIQQIRDPKSHDPASAMPSFGSLTDPQVGQLVSFLESLGTHGKGGSGPSSSGLDPPSQPASAPASPIQQGRDLFSSLACIACHKVHGQGGSVGPDLSEEGSKGRSAQWLAVQIRDPKKHAPASIMPAFATLSDSKVQALAAYLVSLKPPPSAQGLKLPAAGKQGPPGPAARMVGNPAHGKLLYDRDCKQCHGPGGRGGVPNPGATSGRVPPLAPIGRSLFSDHPAAFAESIDRYIQHGAMPSGPHPEKVMPAFGEDLTLTQEMICEVEAYVLDLNGVDRAKILQAGIEPLNFFILTVIVFAAIGLTGGLIWGLARNVGGEPPGAEEIGPTEPDEAAEEPPGQARADQPAPPQPQSPGSRTAFAVIVVVALAVIGGAVSLIFREFVVSRPVPHMAASQAAREVSPRARGGVAFNPPALEDAPADLKPAVLLGHRILMDTRKALPGHVGNKLDCRNCHFEAGLIRKTLSLVGVSSQYPRPIEGQGGAVDLIERTNRCFERSLNGRPLPADGNDMRAILAYYAWISKGVPMYAKVPWLGLAPLSTPPKPEPSAGKEVFAGMCASCHGLDGQGTAIAPPLWGDGSFSDASDMAGRQVFAAFSHAFMPKGAAELTVEQALDVSAFVLSRPRPGPAGGAPTSRPTPRPAAAAAAP